MIANAGKLNAVPFILCQPPKMPESQPSDPPAAVVLYIPPEARVGALSPHVDMFPSDFQHFGSCGGSETIVGITSSVVVIQFIFLFVMQRRGISFHGTWR